MDLTPAEIRVLGCLLEKERTTPDTYPLSLNALVAACNQTTNRDPVVRYRDDDVEAALDGLRRHEVARRGVYPGSRVIKYRHCLDEVLDAGPPALAVLTVLLLRGPQTPGELKARTERLHPFADLAAVEDALDALAGREVPLVVRLGREPGRKESRWAHCLGDGAPASSVAEAPPAAGPAPGPVPEGTAPPTAGNPDLEARVAALEATVAGLLERLDR